MESMKSKLLFVCVIVLFFGVMAFGDWNPGDGHKMHYPQLPDPMGWDIQLDSPPPKAVVLLADDWECSESDWIDDIHFWTSWKGETNFGIREVRIRIYSDIPASQSHTGYSMPGELLSGPGDWGFEAEDGDFTVRTAGTGRQGWYDPTSPTIVGENPILNDHTTYYQVNIENITTKLDRLVCKPVWQKAGNIYWMQIRIIPEYRDGYHVIGWKTSESPPFMDNAVWWDVRSDRWQELFDPITLQPLDLAFVITGDGELDFGDAPDPTYPTTMGNNGAHHVIEGPWLGGKDDAPDAERDGQPHIAALGDDNDGNDDENGVVIPRLYQGETSIVTIDVSGGGGYVSGWVDLDGDGKWHSVIDLVYGPKWLGNGSHNVFVTIPTSADIGPTFARFRIGYERVNRPDGGVVGGEVEDYAVSIGKQDLGDCPDPTYPTKRTSNGARHAVNPNVCLGKLVDGERDGQPTAQADGDDLNSFNDEDGVVFTSPIIPGFKADVDVEASVDGSMSAWFDFNADGDWDDPCEAFFSGEALSAGINTLQFDVPSWAVLGNTYCRFRFIAEQVTMLSYAGPGSEGEVEDYYVYVGERPGERMKWSQPPIEIDPTQPSAIFCGWDEPSWVREGGPPFQWCAPSVADDFRCLGTMPVTSVHWWGSHVNWRGYEPPQSAPIAWNIWFWSDIRAGGAANYSQPGTMLHYIRVPVDRVRITRAGMDQYPGKPMDTCFKYSVSLDDAEYFRQGDFLDQTGDNIFWINIQAAYAQGADTSNAWGWKTRPQGWMDNAVKRKSVPGDPLPQCIWSPVDASTTDGIDMAFELDTDAEWVKWDQPFTGFRHWPYYEDEESMALDNFGKLTYSQLVADDWLCEGMTPVRAVVWWGSYIGYPYRPCQGGLQMGGPKSPSYFVLSIWTDDPSGARHPDQPIWTYTAHDHDYDEVMVGYDKHYRQEPGPFGGSGYEPVYRYSVRLPEADWFSQEEPNTIYWLSIVAVYSPLQQPQYPWGWTNHKHAFGDDAVAGTGFSPGVWNWRELRDPSGASEDMSFALFTEPGCFPSWYTTYADWLRYGKPDCWCGKGTGVTSIPEADLGYQCDGDASMSWENPLRHYRVYIQDLNMLSANWQLKDDVVGLPGGPDPCADIDHKWENPIRKYRVYIQDLNIVIKNWKVRDTVAPPPLLPGDCGTPARPE